VSVDRYHKLFTDYRSKKLFRTADFVTLLGARKNTVRVELSRLAARGLIVRIAKGLYANPYNPPSPEEVAMVLRSPAYISLETALARHGILSQSPVTITLITTDLPFTFHALQRTFEYHHIQRPYFTGFRDQGAFNLACPEKALLDLVYLRFCRTRELGERRLRSLIEDMNLGLINRRSLRRYVRLMKMQKAMERFLPG